MSTTIESQCFNEFIVPSEEIQRLFGFDQRIDKSKHEITDVGIAKEELTRTKRDNSTVVNNPLDICSRNEDEFRNNLSAQIKTIHADDYSFTEEDFSKMPSTLVKVVKRTEALLAQTEFAKKIAIETNNELKGIHSLVVRYAKKNLKESAKNETTQVDLIVENKPVRGFNRKCQISNELCDFIGIPHNSMHSRVDVNRCIYKYIKDNSLIDKDDAQRILPDEKLWSILSDEANNNRITYFSIQKYVKHHYKKKT